MRKQFIQFPELETERLHLRQIRRQDTADIFALFSDDAVTEYLDIVSFQYLDEATNFINFLTNRFDHEQGIRWGIILKGSHRIIGTCGYNIWDKGESRGEIGYELSVPYRRQGIMTEAVQAVLNFGFTTMKLKRVEALVFPENSVSQLFLTKLHFSRYGTEREFQISEGRFVNLVRFGRGKYSHIALESETISPTP